MPPGVMTTTPGDISELASVQGRGRNAVARVTHPSEVVGCPTVTLPSPRGQQVTELRRTAHPIRLGSAHGEAGVKELDRINERGGATGGTETGYQGGGTHPFAGHAAKLREPSALTSPQTPARDGCSAEPRDSSSPDCPREEGTRSAGACSPGDLAHPRHARLDRTDASDLPGVGGRRPRGSDHR